MKQATPFFYFYFYAFPMPLVEERTGCTKRK